MATRIPENVQAFKTDGERTFYRFMQNVAWPDTQYVVWYCPDLDDQEPDFVLYSKNAGAVIFEVKDWSLEQILEADPYTFKIKIGAKVEARTNPPKQASGYMYQLMDEISKDGRLVSKDQAHAGRPIIPICCGVVFTNINKYEYEKQSFQQVIATEKIFFWDDLHPQSDICRDPSGNCFAGVFNKMFKPFFSFNLSGKEMDHLKQLMFPSVRVEIPERSQESYPVRCARLKSLDHHQEAIARNFENGHRILSGPFGCGKTLILVQKAAFLFKYNSGIKTILFVCFNITLVNYIKRLLSFKGLPLGESGVHVTHFYQLCADVIGEEVAYEKEDSIYYDLIVQEALEKLETGGPRYDAVLVDEGQDFSDDMFKVITRVLNQKTDNVTIALDENQNLYRQNFSWSDVGIQARGRVHRISNVYRSTSQLSRFALAFKNGNITTEAKSGGEQRALFPDFYDFTGPAPELVQFKDFGDICTFVADKAVEIVKKDDCPFSEIAFLYVKKTPPGHATVTVPEMIEQALAARGIFSSWVSKNYQNKRAYDITTKSVAVSTIHSAKGFDYACVFLIGLDTFDEEKLTADHIERLAYVGITRARYQLFIPYIKKTPLIEKIQKLIGKIG